MFCFLNYRKTFIDIGFIWGMHITIHTDKLNGGEKRKKLRSLWYYNPEDMDIQAYIDIILYYRNVKF